LNKVIKETDTLKININDNEIQLSNLDANICKIIVQKADKHQANEIQEELNILMEKMDVEKIKLSNLDANLDKNIAYIQKVNDQKANID